MASGNDNMRAARETYTGFIGIVKWTSAISALTAAVVIFLIA